MYDRRGPLLLRILVIEHAFPLRRFINFWEHHFKRLLLMDHVVLGRKSFFGNLLICLQRLRKHLSAPWIAQLIIHVITSFILSKIKALLLKMGVLESCFIALELLKVLIKLLRLNGSPIHYLIMLLCWIISIGSQLVRSFRLSYLPTVEMLLHDLPVGLGLFIILEQVLFDVHRIRIIVPSHLVLDSRRINQVSHLHQVGLFLHALSICMVPLFVVHSVAQILISHLILINVIFYYT
jgi:hypothetical protein